MGYEWTEENSTAISSHNKLILVFDCIQHVCFAFYCYMNAKFYSDLKKRRR